MGKCYYITLTKDKDTSYLAGPYDSKDFARDAIVNAVRKAYQRDRGVMDTSIAIEERNSVKRTLLGYVSPTQSVP